MKTLARLAPVAALALVVVTFTGCHQRLSPEMKGLAHRPADVKNMRQVAHNQNVRMISDDISRAFLMDHPSRLSPYPIIYTSGMPR